MYKLWIFALPALLVGVQGLQNQPFNDYMDLDDYDFLAKFSNEEDNDKKVAADIKMFRNLNANSDDTLGDYQFEDNRFEEDETDDADKEIVNGDDKNKEQKSAEIDQELLVLDDLAKELEDLNKIKESLDDSKAADDNVKEDNDDAIKEEPLHPVEKFDIDTDDIIKSDSNEMPEDSFESLEEVEFSDLFKPEKTEYVDDAEEAKALENGIDDAKESEKKTEGEKVDEELAIDEDDLKSFQEASDDLEQSFERLLKSVLVNDEAQSALTSNEMEEDYNFMLDDYYDANDNQTLPEEPSPEEAVIADEEVIQPLKIEYLHDALYASDEVMNPDAELVNLTASLSTPGKSEDEHGLFDNDRDSNEKSKATSMAGDASTTLAPMSESDYDKMMTEFESQHREEFNVSSDDFDKHVAPIHITITGQPTVVTSPNYPSNYPTNNIVDWIFDGDGEGIELNITDFAVNGHLGDYLLVKPGGVDASGTDGLVFSYNLNTERRYRFMDVRRMFVRFEAKPGMAFTRGFSFSVKMLRPLLFDPVPPPEPEAVIQPAHSAITLNLGGTTLEDFAQTAVEEEFRQIVADMATTYINANSIDPGLNNTSEVTQILSRALCFHNWPKFENCVEVKFGVPLQYDDDDDDDQEPRLNAEDLSLMWATYFGQDPFAARLRRLGVTEYQVPNDSGIMTVWLVIAAGVAIAAAMLAFALWRFSCFEGYTRMPPISDSDSIQEKRNLDLYPTPHQTLPPLYSENEYKWSDPKFDDSARVDMGGYANKNYLKDDLYDLDSDDDVTARNSNKNITPRDIYV